MINVEVAFAGPKVQKILSLQVEQGCTAYDAVVASNIVAVFPEIEVETIPMGIFGKVIRKPREEVLREGDRVELYRPLVADPKVIRARRAAKMQQAEAEANKP
ncbi:RnfH family protein ['Osedax' symbiont bacterium Rs2_46_30_T18]|nr:RnfH family protein ['Osedax' symbiont bacterium Rs2_46_30_T18]